MKELFSTVTSKGQVTIPAEVRKRLGITIGDKLAFIIEDEGEDVGKVALRPVRYPTIASLRGAAGSLPEPRSWEEIETIVREERAEAVRDAGQ